MGREGLLERDGESSYLAGDGVDAGPIDELLSHSITYRIAVGPQQGRKVLTLQTLPASDPQEHLTDTVGKVGGISVHAGVAAKAHERKKLERLCRYVSRPVVSERRLALTANGKVRYQLKTPYRNGTTHVIFEPLDFIARLAALVPKPRVNLTYYHGVFAPNSKHRTWVTPAKRGKGSPAKPPSEPEAPTPAERGASMRWAQRLKRVFNIDIDKSTGEPICTVEDCREAVGYRGVLDDTCRECGGVVKVIASIEDPAVIKKILTHADIKVASAQSGRLPETRAPPQVGLFD